jgi:hypothetical protein
MKTEGFLTCSQVACAKGSWIQNGVQAVPQISLKVLLNFFLIWHGHNVDIKSDKKLKICNFISSSGISLPL